MVISSRLRQAKHIASLNFSRSINCLFDCVRGFVCILPSIDFLTLMHAWVDEPSKGLKIQGRAMNNANIEEDFGSSSTYEMENSAVQSQRSISSISTSNQNPDAQSSAASTSNPSEFVNHGLLLWNQVRQQWIGEKKTQNHTEAREPRLSWNATYESLLGTNKPFPQPVPLPEMVDFLVDVWEQEGLYD